MWVFYLNYKRVSLTTMNPLSSGNFLRSFPFLIVYEARQNLPKYSCLRRGGFLKVSSQLSGLLKVISHHVWSPLTNHSDEAYWKAFAEALRDFIQGVKTTG
jgi:hypothetical protein